MNTNAIHSSYQRIYSQPAYILHTMAYQNTSLLVDAFTADFGRIRFVAKGAKRLKSAFAGKLEVFVPLLLSWSGRGDLYTLTEVDFAQKQKSTSLNCELRGTALLSAYYVNELVLRFLTLEDPHTELFSYYMQTIEKLQSKKNIESVLRNYEKCLLDEIGYSLSLTHDVDTGEATNIEQQYYYVISEGPKRMNSHSKLSDQNNIVEEGVVISGKALMELETGIFTNTESLKQAKHLMRAIISKHLGDVPLKTRTLSQSTIL